ncbi:MAG: hypothetical protein KY468_12030 [Armatimonadetes bacterium]|nr:hypothetical protein [Armatimonadota bacterium]
MEAFIVSAPLQAVHPGSLVSLSFRISNRSGSDEEFMEEVQLPEGWQLIIPAARFTLGPSASQPRLLAVQVPPGAPAGRYSLTYTVHSRREPALRDGERVQVEVLPVSKHSLLSEEAPEVIAAGEPFTIPLRVGNGGNRPIDVALEVGQADKALSLSFDRSRLTLNPGSAERVLLTGKAPERLRRMTTFPLLIRAVNLGDRKVADLSLLLKGVPRVRQTPNPYHTVPTALKLTAMGGEGTGGVQAEWSGRGTLDEGGKKSVDFLFRGPDAYKMSRLGERDELRLNLATEGFSLRLGDQPYGLSTLTSFLQYGRGMEVRYHPSSRAEVGMFTQTPRWGTEPGRSTGAYFRYGIGPHSSVRLNLLNQGPSPKGEKGRRDRLWSLETDLQLNRNTRLQAEYGQSDAESGTPGGDSAYRVELTGRLGRGVNYVYRKVHAGSDYRGYYHDADYTMGSVAVSLDERLLMTLAGSEWTRNLERDPSAAAPSERLLQGNLQYRITPSTQVTVGVDQLRTQDLREGAESDSDRRSLRVGVGQSTARASWNLEYGVGEEHDRLTGRSENIQDFRLLASYRPSAHQQFTIYGGHRQDSRDAFLLGGSNNVGGSVNWTFDNGYSLNAWLTTHNVMGNRPRNDQGQVQLERLFLNGHSIRFLSYYSRFGSQKPVTSYMLTYTLPLDVPVSRKKSQGILQGRIFDSELPGKPGLPNVLVMVNDEAVMSDRDGGFEFGGLPPGMYTLTLDRKSLGPDRIIDRKAPIPVEIVGGNTARLELGVVQAARVSGVVQVVPTQASNDSKETPKRDYVIGDPNASAQERGLDGILVELVGEEETRRTLTDAAGGYLFEGLRPGTWKLTAYETGLPAYHYIENPSIPLQLKPKEQVEQVIRVLPRQRKIILVESQKVESEIPENR